MSKGVRQVFLSQMLFNCPRLSIDSQIHSQFLSHEAKSETNSFININMGYSDSRLTMTVKRSGHEK